MSTPKRTAIYRPEPWLTVADVTWSHWDLSHGTRTTLRALIRLAVRDCCPRKRRGREFEPSVDRKAHNGFRDRAVGLGPAHCRSRLRASASTVAPLTLARDDA
jgi:hypothetical protein